MAKLTKKYSFKGATLSKSGEKYILTEISKDDSQDYNLSAILDAMIGTEGISFSIGADDEVPPMDA